MQYSQNPRVFRREFWIADLCASWLRPTKTPLPGRNMKIDDDFKFHGQRYICTGYQNYETRDGRWLELLVLESDCPDCGREFRLVTTKTNAKHRLLTRRCEDCHRPGVPVAPRRRAPIVVAKPTKRAAQRKARRPEPVSASTMARGADAASPDNIAQASAAARMTAAVADESAPILVAAVIEQKATGETYLESLGMLD